MKDNPGKEMILVTFSIMDEIYGVPVHRVREIVGISRARSVPETLPFMKGVINLRGVVVPLIDMRIKFGLEEKEYDKRTVILIVEAADTFFGMIVDYVSDVITFPAESVQDTPHFSAKVDADSVMGIVELKGQIIVLLDIDAILTTDELSAINESASLDFISSDEKKNNISEELNEVE